MSHTPHELSEDFPEQAETIHRLREENAHFARLADEYAEVNRKVHRAETNPDPMDTLAEQDLRKRRMQLKDEIARMLSENA